LGAGGAYNCVKSVGSDTPQFDGGGPRGTCIMAQGSEAVAAVYLW